MPLKINLKAGDSLLIGGSRFTITGEGYSTIIIDGEIPVLRESEAITATQATDPQTRFYFHLQQFYLTGAQDHLDRARTLAPSLAGHEAVHRALEQLDQNKPFQALKTARVLVKDILRIEKS